MENFDKSQYKVKRLFHDEHFINGFNVQHLKKDENGKVLFTPWQFPESNGKPEWLIFDFHSLYCLAVDRKDVGDPYVLTDIKDSKYVKYNPEDHSLVMKIDGSKIYDGGTEVPKSWPHLLIAQNRICDYKNMPEGDEKRFYSANSDKIMVEFDMRIPEFIPSKVKEGDQRCQFVAYAYLQHVEKNFIYYGYRPMITGGGTQYHFFNKETGGNNFIYSLGTETMYGSFENSFVDENGNVKVTNEWKHVEIDLTPHIDNIIEKANKELIFGEPVKREDFYFSGTNMGFEIHNNMSCTVEVKNYNLVSYIKK